MSNNQRERIAGELLSVLATKGTPDIILIDCDLQKRLSSPDRPWPFSDANEAAMFFEKLSKAGRKKYGDIAVSLKENTLELSKIE